MSIAQVAMSVGRFARNRVRRARAAEHWLTRLNEYLSPDEVRIRRLLHEEPRIEIIGPLPLSNEAELLAEQHRTRLSQNDAVATFEGTPSWTDNPVHLRAVVSRVLWKNGERPSGWRPA